MVDRLAVLFTKPATPGKVKTRLIGALTAEEAALLHAAFVDDLLARLRGGAFELRVAWAVADGEPLPALEPNAARQVGKDLGERMFLGLTEAAEEAEYVAAIGSDHPQLSRQHVEEAFSTLEGNSSDLVCGPTHDGGYYLIAARRRTLRPEIFEGIPWSTDAVLRTTLARCAALDLRVALLPELADVDRPEDLEDLERAIAAGSCESPRTEELLRSWRASARKVQT